MLPEGTMQLHQLVQLFSALPLDKSNQKWYNNCVLISCHAGVMELVDVVDSKSTASDGVPVRVRPPAPQLKSSQTLDMTGFAGFSLCSALLMYCPSHISRFAVYRLILGGTSEGHRALSGGIYTQNCVGRRNL